jgi:putative ABC transport system permease protein
MKISELIRIANRNLFRAKLRTFLTVMAIFVGSFTLTLTNGLSDGLRDYIENQVKNNLEGNNLVFARKKFPSEEAENAEADTPREYKEATEDDAGNMIDPNSFSVSLAQMEAIAREMPEVKTGDAALLD